MPGPGPSSGTAGVLRSPLTTYQVDSVLCALPFVLAHGSVAFLGLYDHKEVKESNYDCNFLNDWNLVISLNMSVKRKKIAGNVTTDQTVTIQSQSNLASQFDISAGAWVTS